MEDLRFMGRPKKPTAEEVLQWIEAGSRPAMAIRQRMAQMSVKGRSRLRRLLREKAKAYREALKRPARPSRGKRAIRIADMGLNLKVSCNMRLIPTLIENGGIDLRLWRVDGQELRPTRRGFVLPLGLVDRLVPLLLELKEGRA